MTEKRRKFQHEYLIRKQKKSVSDHLYKTTRFNPSTSGKKTQCTRNDRERDQRFTIPQVRNRDGSRDRRISLF